jgi:hypothetical protein
MNIVIEIPDAIVLAYITIAFAMAMFTAQGEDKPATAAWWFGGGFVSFLAVLWWGGLFA